ncbi:hypothetical protein [Amycolatopsis sp. H20-H5]|uniref:hypothetical protein n=1 Tax=Amycolatopsis sp. H20-H5 TaxID=3046309 RepID=UPI002DB86D77|nr:hypothetical protein [Amycolatopsis sp. H20-H5]MEC3978057.1 hypothetical protein [Amycolatopsis sp. H20-H5]
MDIDEAAGGELVDGERRHHQHQVRVWHQDPLEVDTPRRCPPLGRGVLVFDGPFCSPIEWFKGQAYAFIFRMDKALVRRLSVAWRR